MSVHLLCDLELLLKFGKDVLIGDFEMSWLLLRLLLSLKIGLLLFLTARVIVK